MHSVFDIHRDKLHYAGGYHDDEFCDCEEDSGDDDDSAAELANVATEGATNESTSEQSSRADEAEEKAEKLHCIVRFLDGARILRDDAVLDPEYVANCSSSADLIHNRGGMYMIREPYMSFGRSLMDTSCKVQILVHVLLRDLLPFLLLESPIIELFPRFFSCHENRNVMFECRQFKMPENNPSHPSISIISTSPMPGASVRGDCYDVRDMYTACVQMKKTDSPICAAVVAKYLSCSQSEK